MTQYILFHGLIITEISRRGAETDCRPHLPPAFPHPCSRRQCHRHRHMRWAAVCVVHRRGLGLCHCERNKGWGQFWRASIRLLSRKPIEGRQYLNLSNQWEARSAFTLKCSLLLFVDGQCSCQSQSTTPDSEAQLILTFHIESLLRKKI